MRSTPRFLATRLSRRERAVYGGVTVLFLGLFAASIWPVYPLFAGIRPLVLGVPFSLVYVVLLLAVGFSALLAVFLWEGRRGIDRDDRGRPPAGGPPGGPPRSARRAGARDAEGR